MDKFLNKQREPKSHAASFNAADRAKQCQSELYEDGGKCFVTPAMLFCRAISSPLLTVDDQLKCRAHFQCRESASVK